PSFCHSDRSEAQCPALAGLPLLISVKLSARDETSTAAHIRRVHQNRFRKIHAVVAPLLSSGAGNNAVSKRARSRRRSGMRGAARKQRASRSLRSARLRPAAHTGSSEDRYPEASTIIRDHIRRN